MRLDIKSGGEWLHVPVLDTVLFIDKKDPDIMVVYDQTHSGYQALSDANMKIATLRIDRQEGRYGIDLAECPTIAPGKVMFIWLGICKAQQIPDGTKFTVR